MPFLCFTLLEVIRSFLFNILFIVAIEGECKLIRLYLIYDA
jgi:hypothetical protein